MDPSLYSIDGWRDGEELITLRTDYAISILDESSIIPFMPMYSYPASNVTISAYDTGGYVSWIEPQPYRIFYEPAYYSFRLYDVKPD